MLPKLVLLFRLVGAAAAQGSDYALPPPPAVSTGTQLRFTADHVEYDAPTTTLHLRGRVAVNDSSRTIKADELWLDTKERSGRSEGYLFVQDESGAVAGESGEFQFEERTGRLKKAKAGYGDWRVHAKEARLDGKNKLIYKSADFTSCDYVPPHYRFHASRVTVVPKKRIMAYNTFFFLGPVPVLYIPVLYKSLDPNSVIPMKFQPGYDRRNGAYLKGTMTKTLGPNTYNKLYLDFYSAQGVGVGSELQHHEGENRGVLFGYRIREQHNGTERWTVISNAYQTVRSSVALQGLLWVQSDASFNNHYSRGSLFRVTPELINDAAATYRHRVYNLRLAYSRRDIAADNRIQYLKTTEDLPRFDLQTTQLTIWRLPWLNTFKAFGANNFTRGRPYFERSAGAGWEGTRVFPLGRGFSFVPKVDYTQTWLNRFDQPNSFSSSDTFRDSLIGRHHVQGNIRWTTKHAGNWDLSYDHTGRLKPGTMMSDAGALDHGVEQNLLSLREIYRPHRAIFMRAFSGYDFRVFRDRTMSFHERVQPMVGEIYYTPTPTMNFGIRDDYQMGVGNRSLLASALYGREEASYIQATAGYNRYAPNRYNFDTMFAVANASMTWRLGAALRSEVFTSGGIKGIAAERYRLFEKEISIAHAWHDFFGRLLLRFRPGGVREATVRIDLKFGPGKTNNSMPRRDWEAEWFPERASGVHDRP